MNKMILVLGMFVVFGCDTGDPRMDCLDKPDGGNTCDVALEDAGPPDCDVPQNWIDYQYTCGRTCMTDFTFGFEQKVCHEHLEGLEPRSYGVTNRFGLPEVVCFCVPFDFVAPWPEVYER